MKSLICAAALATGLVAATPAMAAEITLTNTGSAFTGSFGHTPDEGAFSNTFTFTVPSNGGVSAQVSTIGFAVASNIDFTSVKLNGIALTLTPTGTLEMAYTASPIAVTSGLQTLIVEGVAGSSASYSGTVNFATAVPETATWGMMILGFGAIGASLRYRRRKTTAVFA